MNETCAAGAFESNTSCSSDSPLRSFIMVNRFTGVDEIIIADSNLNYGQQPQHWNGDRTSGAQKREPDEAKSSLHKGKPHPPTIVSLINLKRLTHITIQYVSVPFTSFHRSVNSDGLGNFLQPLDDTHAHHNLWIKWSNFSAPLKHDLVKIKGEKARKGRVTAERLPFEGWWRICIKENPLG